jgi:hypothetical protein
MEEPEDTMKKVLFTIVFFCACGDDGFGSTEGGLFVPPDSLPRCGGNTPCKCGYLLAENRILDGRDELENCDFNTVLPALTLAFGAKLDCSGRKISVRLNAKGNYNSNRPAIWILSDSHGSEVKNCEIFGFSEAIYAELEYVYGQYSVEEKIPKDLSFIGNKIILGEGSCNYGGYCEANGIFIPGTTKTFSENITVVNNYFGMARSPLTDKDSFLHYGSYFRTTAAKNVVIGGNYFDKINYGYAVRLLYGVENIWMFGNTFRMPWKRYALQKWTPSGIGVELYNSAKDGYPQFSVLAFNAFFIGEDECWPPEPFGMPPYTGVNHEYVGIRSGWDASVPAINASLNWWKRLDGSNYSDADVRRLVYSKNYQVNGAKYEQDYREVIYLPRLY